MNKEKGFTLLELVLVVAIMAILITITNINYSIIDRIEGKNQIKELVYNINQLRTYSQINNKSTFINLDDRGYTLNFSGKSQRYIFNKKVILLETNLKTLRFTSRGKPSYRNKENSAGTIIYAINNKIYKITIEPVTGKVNFKSGEG